MGMGMEIDQWEWEGMGILIVFLHTSSLHQQLYCCIVKVHRPRIKVKVKVKILDQGQGIAVFSLRATIRHQCLDGRASFSTDRTVRACCTCPAAASHVSQFDVAVCGVSVARAGVLGRRRI